MGQAIEQRGGHLGIAKHAGPLAEAEVGGDDEIECAKRRLFAFPVTK